MIKTDMQRQMERAAALAKKQQLLADAQHGQKQQHDLAKKQQEMEAQKKKQAEADARAKDQAKAKQIQAQKAAAKAAAEAEAAKKAEAAAAAASAAAAAAAKPAWNATAPAKSRQQRGPSLAEIQAEEARAAKQRDSLRQAQGYAKRGATMAERIARQNGGNNPQAQTAHLKNLLGVESPLPSAARKTRQGGPKKSLLEIQQEEAMMQAKRQSSQTQQRTSKPGSWGAVAAAGAGPQVASTKSSVQARQAPSSDSGGADLRLFDYDEGNAPSKVGAQQQHQQLTQTQQAAQRQRLAKQQQAQRARLAQQQREQQRAAQLAAQRQAELQKNVKPTKAKDFGGKELPEGMARWATQELRKIRKGNGDLTLVHFCMTLSDSSDIREYVREVLGTTPQASAFASEFLKRKRAAKKKGRR